MLYKNVMSVGSTVKKLSCNHCGHVPRMWGVNFSQSTQSMNVFFRRNIFKKVLKRIRDIIRWMMTKKYNIQMNCFIKIVFLNARQTCEDYIFKVLGGGEESHSGNIR